MAIRWIIHNVFNRFSSILDSRVGGCLCLLGLTFQPFTLIAGQLTHNFLDFALQILGSNSNWLFKAHNISPLTGFALSTR
ncbi:hypothetical protein CYB_2827 [Synechococcus sp. JA-2-3B'a(2-13)]|nr:hypothetical protein CYB_2827 [Synechococcus sp. JA-2-3B'a(2-13)]